MTRWPVIRAANIQLVYICENIILSEPFSCQAYFHFH